ncbi:MAG: hypothetical protein GY951_18425 [Psychromonas sp.]|nr:hypothetical protein [Psychromonas sp.]
MNDLKTVYSVEYPFYMGDHSRYIDGEFVPDEVWIPGCKVVDCPPDDAELIADAMGEMILTIVDIYKPGRYPERVFYTRKWVDPDGGKFGAGKLHITTTPTFKKRTLGYYHEYKLAYH